jgi:ABC-type branched-subunit amino acid transport system ATPase component/ABC-type branched-subunit amino acid transport system permease subunit
VTVVATPRRIALALLTVVALVIVLAVPWWASDYELLVAYQIAQLAALAQAWNLMAGYGGLVSLAVAAFVGVGSYATTKLSLAAGLTLIPSVLVGGVFAALFALIVAVPMFRFRGPYFTIGSLVLAQALAIFMSNYNGLGGNQGLSLESAAPSQSDLYMLVLVAALVITAATVIVVRGKLGLGLMAVRDDEDVAERVGVRTFRTKLVAFVISAAIMGIVGGVQAQYLGHIEPTGSFSLNWTIDSVNAAIIGGVGTVLGPLIGAAASIELSTRLSHLPEVHLMIIGALLILIVRFAPAGIWGTLCQRARGPLQRRLPGWLFAVPRAPAPGSGRPPLQAVAGGEGNEPAIVMRAVGVGKAFGGVKAVDAVDIEVRSGEILGVIGPNGAGKSTLIGLLSGAIAGEGQVELFGEDVTDASAQVRARRGVGRTHQVPRPFGQLTVLENLLVAQMHGAANGRAAAHAEVERILELCGLSEFADVAAKDLGLLRLKRLELARALAVNPKLLFLDEIGAGLIDSEVLELIDLIKRLRHEVESIVIVEHVLDVIRECCDRLVVLDRGCKLLEGEPDEALDDPEVAAVYLGTVGGREIRAQADRRPRSSTPLLVVEGVSARYGDGAFRALDDVSLTVAEGEVLSLLGANGAGKTTAARVISGMLAVAGGTIHFGGNRIDGLRVDQVVSAGLAHCMEGRRIFGDLSVEENLLIAARPSDSRAERRRDVDGVFDLFGDLRERRGNSGSELSGGQQQMLAIGRTLMAKPRLAIFDEISIGLAPIIVDRLYDALAEINQQGLTMIVIEQNVERGISLADEVAVLEKGRIALAGVPEEIQRDPRLRALYVGEAKASA